MGNRRLPPGTIIMIGLISHLANVGLAAYIADMIEAEKKLKNLYIREIKISPLPPSSLTGINTPVLVRELFEFNTWALDYSPADCLLEDSIKVTVDIMKKNGDGRQPYLEPRRMHLPAR
jgi:hypothetical protein